MKKKIKKKVKKKIRKVNKYVAAGFQQVDYGPNVIQTGALNQNQQAYLNAQTSNYQTGQDIANMDASMTLDMIQKQQQASASRGIGAGKELLRGDRTKEFLKGFRSDQTITGQTIGGETVPGLTGAEQPASQVSNSLSSTNLPDYPLQPSQLSSVPNVNSNLPGLNIEATPLTNAPASTAPGPVPSGGGAEIAIDPSKSAFNQAVKAPDKVITKTKAPLLGQSGKIAQGLSKSALGTTSSGAATGFSNFGAAASTYALPAVILGEGAKYLSDDDDPTTMNVGETTGTVLSGAGQGAGIGSMIGGPVGAGIGAIIGAGVGVVKGIKARNKARDAEEVRKEEVADLRKRYRLDRKNYLSTATPGMQKGTYYMGEMGGMNPNMSFKQKLRTQMAMGGIKPMNNQGDMIVYGPTHEQGGVMRDATTELEGGGMKNGQALPGEVVTQIMDDGGMNREYYFSDHLKNPSTGNTFAEDYINTGGMNQDAKQTFAKLQELVAGRTDKDRSPQTIAKKGGFGERLDEISDQLAGASKMHAGQSKKIESMAKQLLKKAMGGYKMYDDGGMGATDYPISGAAPGTIFPEYQAENLPFYQEPMLGLGNFKTVDVEGSGMQAVFDIRTGELVNYKSKPIGGAGSLEYVTGKGSSSFAKLIPNVTKSVINPKALAQGQKVLPSGQKLLPSGQKLIGAPKTGLPAPKSNVPMVINKLPATTRNVPARNIPGMGGGAAGPTTGGPMYDLLQFNKVNTLLPQIINVGTERLSSDPIARNQYVLDNLRPEEEPVGSTDPVDNTVESTESTEVNTNNIENAGRPGLKFDDATLDRQKEINKFFNSPDPDLPGQTYGDQYGIENLDEDGLLGPKTKAALKTFEFAKEREADFDEARNFNQSIFDGQAAQDPVVGNIDGDPDDIAYQKSLEEGSNESGLLDRLLGNKNALRSGLAGLSYGANLLNAKKQLDEMEKLKVTPEKVTPERLGKIKITNEAERKMVQESTNAALSQAGSPEERIALLSKQAEVIGKSEEGRRNKQLVADLEVDKINNKNAFQSEIYNVANEFKAQIENLGIQSSVKKGRIDIMNKFADAISTMALDANKMETAYKNMKEYGEAVAGGVGNLEEKMMETLIDFGFPKEDAKNKVNEIFQK